MPQKSHKYNKICPKFEKSLVAISHSSTPKSNKTKPKSHFQAQTNGSSEQDLIKFEDVAHHQILSQNRTHFISCKRAQQRKKTKGKTSFHFHVRHFLKAKGPMKGKHTKEEVENRLKHISCPPFFSFLSHPSPHPQASFYFPNNQAKEIPRCSKSKTKEIVK